MIYERQKHLIALVNALGGEVGALDFQKLLLLYCLEAGGSTPYEFVPYKYGGFSFTSYADKRRLIEKGLLADDDRTWKLTSEGKATTITMAMQMAALRFAKRYTGLRGDKLVRETYLRYPYYAIRSEMAERVLSGDSHTLEAIMTARARKSIPGLCTIGYEGRTLEGYLNTLIQDNVTLLCDVRQNPISRKYGFSKSTLKHSCEGVGIRYEHLPELGVPSEDRQSLKSPEDYNALFESYKHKVLPDKRSTLTGILNWITQGERVALTCYERLPEQCHRTCLAKEMAKRFGRVCTPKYL